MQRDRSHLLDILEACRLALSYIEHRTESDFLSDTQCQDSVIRRLEIIGEAARRISEPTRAAHPELPWEEMIGLRNVLIHEYDAVDLPLLWQTVHNDLPRLVVMVQAVLEGRH